MSISSWFIHLQLAMPKGCFKVATAIVVVVFLLVTAYRVYRPVNTLSISHLSHFTVVLDCGSTGSRVNVYKWIKNGTGDEDHPVLLQTSPDHLNKGLGEGATCQYHCVQTEPGLDKFVHNVSGIREVIEPLILWAEQHVPPERHGDTSLFVLATAGLRKLPNEDADWILDTVETVVKAHPFVYRRSWIRVLSGQEEGYYGWAALNYKMGRLRNSIKVPTFGVLDMGGSSLQVVMETHTLRESHDILRLKLGSLEHKILAYSMTEFGLNEAFDRSVVMLSEEKSLTRNNGGRIQLRHPCLSSSVSLNYTCRVCFHPNATNWEEDFSGKLPRKQSDSLSLVGVPNWKQCKELATRAASIRSSNTELLQLIMDMNGKVNFSSSESGLQNLIIFPLQGARFHALSGFFAVYDVLNLNPNENLTTIMTRARELCSHLWSGSKKFPGNRKYAEQFCFNVLYLASLIKDALCMGDTNLIFGPGDVSWTLGAALVEGKSAWLHTLEAQGGSSNFEIMKVISSPILLIILLLFLSFVVYLGQGMANAITCASMSLKKSAAFSLPSFISPKRQSN